MPVRPKPEDWSEETREGEPEDIGEALDEIPEEDDDAEPLPFCDPPGEPA